MDMVDENVVEESEAVLSKDLDLIGNDFVILAPSNFYGKENNSKVLVFEATFIDVKGSVKSLAEIEIIPINKIAKEKIEAVQKVVVLVIKVPINSNLIRIVVDYNYSIFNVMDVVDVATNAKTVVFIERIVKSCVNIDDYYAIVVMAQPAAPYDLID